MLFSCGGGDNIGKNPYCEFVDGNYTFDIDLRRSMFYVGKDFHYQYFNSDMEECRVEDATFLKLKAIGNYFDENVHEEEDVDIFYTSLIKLPKENRVNQSAINLLTSLETERVIYLMHSGYEYQEAKKKTHEEIWKQLKESGLFNHYDFLKVQAFEDLQIDDDCLSSLTLYFSRLIFNAAKVVEDKSMCGSVMHDFIDSYALSGDLGLVSLNKDIFSKPEDEFFSLSNQERILKYSVSYYNMPFEGGIPHIFRGKIYYGIDTSSYENKLVLTADDGIRLTWPKYGKFTTNGYVDLQGNLLVDTLNTEIPLEVIVNDINNKTLYSTTDIGINPKHPYFASTIWLEKEGEFQITLQYGDQEMSLMVNNKLEFDQVEKQEEQSISKKL